MHTSLPRVECMGAYGRVTTLPRVECMGAYGRVTSHPRVECMEAGGKHLEATWYFMAEKPVPCLQPPRPRDRHSSQGTHSE